MFIDMPGSKVMAFEGGSLRREEVEWMLKFNNKTMNSLYKSYAKKCNIATIQDGPSMKVVERAD